MIVKNTHTSSFSKERKLKGFSKKNEWRKIIVYFLPILFAFFFNQYTHAQTVETGTYDLRFGKISAECSAPFCITLQIRSAVPGESFFVGSHTIFINYTTNTLDDPTYTSFNFNDIDLCALGGTYAPYFY